MKYVIMVLMFLVIPNPAYAVDFGARFKTSTAKINSSPDRLAKKVQSLYDNSNGDFIDDKESRDELILMAKINLQDHYENIIFLASKKKHLPGFAAAVQKVCGKRLAQKLLSSLSQFDLKWGEFDRHDKIEMLAEELANEDLKETIRVAEEEVTPLLRVKANKVSHIMRNSDSKN